MIAANLTIFGSEYYKFIPEVEYQAVLDKATLLGYGMPTNREIFYQNEMVKALKVAGIWNRLDQLYVWYNSAGFDFSSINWINTSFLLTRNPSYPSVFIHKEGVRLGYSGIGSNFTSTFNSQANSGKYLVGDASFGWVNGLSDNLDGQFSGVKSHNNNQLWFRFHVDSQRGRSYFQQGEGYTSSVMSAAVPLNKSNSFVINTRSVSNTKIFLNGNKYRDATISYLGTTGTVASSSVNYSFDFGYKGNTNIDTLRMAFTGGNLTEAQCISFTTIWNNYINSI